MKRYHPALVALHWILLLMIFAMMVIGSQVMAPTASTDPDKIDLLKMHMIIGNIILALMVVRLLVRMKSQKPPEADIGNALLNKAGRLAHLGLYALVFAMIASGWATAIAAGLPGIVFFDSGAELPADMKIFAPRVAHGVISYLLAFLIVAHFAAAMYHQFIRKDRLLSRMWFGKGK